ncbi:MAG: hypothetical protein Unbinned3138contig1000_65 [Prokaryotic dsDNA virus sp.]|nr:MAG: hypothetical protein Unbinned3138contig1000_65 [Prokaryotic dsDNA virus sp.]|tara:strand:- start:2223 stop:2492 length:270 start_codon:yes stop_codon:yes gene_type:complete
MKMPAPTMPAPAAAEPSSRETSGPPRRRLNPDIELFQSCDTGQFVAVLTYNRVKSFSRPCDTREEAQDASFQFYLEHTAAGRAVSESVT